MAYGFVLFKDKQKKVINLLTEFQRGESGEPGRIACVVSECSDGVSVEIDGLMGDERRVKDVFRYRVKFSRGEEGLQVTCAPLAENEVIGSNFNDSFADSINGTRVIVLIIESPHRNEYVSGTLSPISPAQGATGLNIAKFIADVLRQSLSRQRRGGVDIQYDVDYQLVICNPVQFQASLFHLHGRSLSGKAEKMLRNISWRALFEIESRDFIARLSRYMPKMIINACTVELQSDVGFVVAQWVRCKEKRGQAAPAVFVAAGHPASWARNRNNRTLIRIWPR